MRVVAEQQVGSGRAGDRVVAAAAHDALGGCDLVARARGPVRRPAVVRQQVRGGHGDALDVVVVASEVGAVAAVLHVGPGTAEHDLGARSTAQRVGTGAAVEHGEGPVVPEGEAAAREGVVAVAAREEVVAVRAGRVERVVAVVADEPLVLARPGLDRVVAAAAVELVRPGLAVDLGVDDACDLAAVVAVAEVEADEVDGAERARGLPGGPGGAAGAGREPGARVGDPVVRRRLLDDDLVRLAGGRAEGQGGAADGHGPRGRRRGQDCCEQPAEQGRARKAHQSSWHGYGGLPDSDCVRATLSRRHFRMQSYIR